MAGNIKGITIEFDGNTTKLSKALSDIKDKSKGVDSALRDVNKALKFNPGNTELLAQKQTLLKEKIQATKDRLEAFKQAQQSLDSQGIDKTSKEYMEVRRNIIQCESQIKTFNAELKKTDAAASHIGQLGKKFQDTGEKISSAGRTFAPVSKAAGVVAGALGATAYKAARAADDINTLSKVSGIGTKELQLYAASADLVDVSVEDMAKAQTKLKKNMFNAAKGTGDAAIAFDKLGVKVVGNDGHLRNQNDVFQETIKKLGSMKNETERDALAMQIFGKSATQLNPMIEDMGRTYQLVTETMKKNKIKFVDQETLDQANAFNDQVDTMKFIAITAFQQIGSKIAAALLPAITKIQEGFSKVMGYISNMDGRVLAVITGIAGAIATVAPALLIVGGLTSKFGKALSSLAKIAPGFSGALGKAFGFLKANPIILVVAALAALALMIGKAGMSAEQISGKVTGFVKSAVNVINGIVAKLPGIISALIKGLVAMLPALVQGAVTLFMGLVQALPKVIPTLIQGVVALITRVVQALTSVLPTLVQGAITLFMGLVQALPKVIPTLIQSVVALVTKVAQALTTVLPTLVEGAITLFMGLVQALPQILPALIQGIIQLMTLGIQILPTMMPALINAAIMLFMGIVKAIPVIVAALIQAMPQILNAILAGLQPVIGIVGDVFENVKNKISEIWESIVETVSQIIENLKQSISAAWEEIKSATSVIWEGIKAVITGAWDVIVSIAKFYIETYKTIVTTAWNAIKAVTSAVWNGIKLVITTAWDLIKNGVTTAINGVKSIVENVWNSIKSVTSTVWNAIKSAITSPINAAYNAVSNIIQRMRALFNFKWKLPHLKLPHISISGGFSLKPLKVPHFSLSWYKEGGIFDKPTIAGIGEAGSEAVLPTHKLDKFLNDAVVRVTAQRDTEIVSALGQILLAIQNMDAGMADKLKIYLNTGQLVSETAPMFDEALGKLAYRKARG